MYNLVQAGLQIVKLVGIDLPTTIFTRFISSYQKVTGCRRERNEKLSSFVSCFCGLAARHLLHSQAFSFSQFGEVLASTILNHAMLEEVAFTNAKIQLIVHAESRV